MNKLRSDSAFCQLTPEQADTLEGWLFEERLGYPKVVEKLKAEFGLETSLTGVRRFYKRLDVERSAQSLMDAAEMSGATVQALKNGELKPAMLLYANKCLFELLRQEPVPIKEVTTLLRAITSAEARAFRQTIDDREQAELKEAKRLRAVEAERRWARAEIAREDEALERKRAARKKAKLKAAEKAVKKSETCAGTAMSAGRSPSPQPSGFPSPPPVSFPKADERFALSGPPGEGEELAQRTVNGASVAPVVPAAQEPSVPTAGPATNYAGGAWQPGVVEEPEYAENEVVEAAENRLAPLNAA